MVGQIKNLKFREKETLVLMRYINLPVNRDHLTAIPTLPYMNQLPNSRL
jgi:hypothetical protein